MAQLLSFKFEWSHQPYPVAPRVSQQAFEMPLGAFLHNLDVKLENVVGAGTAAARNVGSEQGQLMQVGAFGLGNPTATLLTGPIEEKAVACFFRYEDGSRFLPSKMGIYDTYGIRLPRHQDGFGAALFLPYYAFSAKQICLRVFGGAVYSDYYLWSNQNSVVDGNGFIKAASPIADLYADHIVLNDEAKLQQVNFERLDVGHYLISGSLGFAHEGWYIETPKDANGNVLVAVKYQQLEDNTIEVKTFAKKFDEETGDVVPNLAKPRDIPTGRFISLRLQELPEPEIPESIAPEDFQPTNLARAVAEYMETDVPGILTEQEPAE